MLFQTFFIEEPRGSTSRDGDKLGVVLDLFETGQVTAEHPP